MCKSNLNMVDYILIGIFFVFAAVLSPAMPLLSTDGAMHQTVISIHAWQRPDFLRIDSINGQDISIYSHQPYLSYVIYAFFMSFAKTISGKLFISGLLSTIISVMGWSSLYVFLRKCIGLSIKTSLVSVIVTATIAFAPMKSLIPTYDVFLILISVLWCWAIIQYEYTYNKLFLYMLYVVSVVGILINWFTVILIFVYGSYKMIHTLLISKSILQSTIKNPIFWYSFVCAIITLLQTMFIVYQLDIQYKDSISNTGYSGGVLLKHFSINGMYYSKINSIKIIGPILPVIILCAILCKRLKIYLSVPEKIIIYILFTSILICIILIPSLAMGYLYPWLFVFPAISLLVGKIYNQTTICLKQGILNTIYKIYVIGGSILYIILIGYVFIYLIPGIGLRPYANTVVQLIEKHTSIDFNVSTVLGKGGRKIASKDGKYTCSPFYNGLWALVNLKPDIQHYNRGNKVPQIDVYCINKNTTVFENVDTDEKVYVLYPEKYRQQRLFILNIYDYIR